MISDHDIREFILEPAMRQLSQRFIASEVMFDSGPIEERDFQLLRVYFPGPERFNEGLIEDMEVCRAVASKIFETVSEWHSRESGGVNPLISGIGFSEQFELIDWPNDWEAMNGDIPRDAVPYCLRVWIGFAYWPEVAASFG